MRISWKHIVISLFLYVLVFTANAQSKVEVITKTIEKTVRYTPGFTLRIEGHSANIKVIGWEKATIQVEIKLISKGLNMQIAKKELEYQKYVINDVDKTHSIRNYLLLPKNVAKLSTIQETHIQVFVPSHITVDVRNKFGKIGIQNQIGNLTIENEYGDVSLVNNKGQHHVLSHFGDLNIENLQGDFSYNLVQTETIINGIKGKGTIKSNLGNIEIENIDKHSEIKIDAIKSDVKWKSDNLNQFHLLCESKYGEIKAPKELSISSTGKNGNNLSNGDKSLSELNIKTDYGLIEIINL